MNPPLIRIEDHSSQPAITVLYLSGDNELDLKTIYPRIKSLLTHPKCNHNFPHEDTWPCPSCEQAFLNLYWSSAATLLDYFADFHSTDTALMRSIWFHLLDVWQEAATWLPCDDALERIDPGSHFQSAETFLQHVKATLHVFETTLFGTKRKSVPRDPIIHNPSGEAKSPAGEYETGPWVSGLKPWQQFLCEESPGVAAPPSSASSLLSSKPTEEETQDSSTSTSTRSSAERIRHIPMPAISIMQKHTQRARSLAAKLASTTTTSTAPIDAVELLSTFDNHALTFPSSTSASQTHTYTSSLTGSSITYQLTNGAPLNSRYQGLGDPIMLVDSPTWTLVDECVGVCKGVEAYEVQGGGDGDEGEGDEGDEEEVFDMWTLFESGVVEGKEGVEGGSRLVLEGYGEMFEEWCEEDMF